MKRSLGFLISSFCIVACTAIPCLAKEWRGIVPLRSTRSDVIKLLGNPTHALWNYREYFMFDNERVRFEWIDPTCVKKYPIELDTEVRSSDLVLNISVTPKKPFPLEELGLPSDKFYFMDCFGRDDCTFMDFDGGFAYSTTKDGVTGLSYSATAKEFEAWIQEHKSCQSSRQF
jgi:hypothetical protein